MTDAATVADRYIALWNEADPARRQGLIEAVWTDDACYVDPLMQGQGRDQIDALVAAVHARFPGHRFALAGQPDGYADRIRFSWTLGAEGQPSIAHGTDFGVLAEDGRLRSVTGFLDQIAA